MLALYIILIVSTLAVIGAGLAFHYRVKRHMSSPGEAVHSEPLTQDPAPGNEQSS